MLNHCDLKGKVAIITGASRGIGRVIAARVAQAGAQTVLVARSRQDLKLVADEILATSFGAPNPHIVEADLRNDDEVHAVVRGTFEKFEKISILINNAAAFAHATVADLNPKEWDRVIDTNLRAVFLLCREVVPYMTRGGGGDLVNICSTSGKRGDAGGSAYAASKFAMSGFSQSLFAEVRAAGIRVNVIYPSSVDTSERELSPGVVRPNRLCAEDIADSVLFSLLLPGGVTVKQIELWNTRTNR